MTLVQPCGDMSVKIRESLREPDSDAIDRDVAAIKKWLTTQPHLPRDMDDQRLKTFLRGCKFSLEKVKKKLDMYYTMRNMCPEFFTNRDVSSPELKFILDRVNIPVLPGLTPKGMRVTIMRGLDKHEMNAETSDALKLSMMMGDIRLLEESVGVAGDVYIFDASVATPAHLVKFQPTVVKKFFICVQEAYPVKLKEVHIVNVSPFVDTIVNFVKPFIKEKIRQRIHFHSDMESLYKFVPKAMLPTEYGGDSGSIQVLHEQWVAKMLSYAPWFKEQEKSKANESLRPGAPKTADELFGMDGTFRKLTID